MIDIVILDKAIGIVSLIIVIIWILFLIYEEIKKGYNIIKEKGFKKLIINILRNIILACILIGIVFGIPVCIVYIVIKFIS